MCVHVLNQTQTRLQTGKLVQTSQTKSINLPKLTQSKTAQCEQLLSVPSVSGSAGLFPRTHTPTDTFIRSTVLFGGGGGIAAHARAVISASLLHCPRPRAVSQNNVHECRNVTKKRDGGLSMGECQIGQFFSASPHPASRHPRTHTHTQ